MSDQTSPESQLYTAQKKWVITLFFAAFAGLLIFPNFLPSNEPERLPTFERTGVVEFIRAHEAFVAQYKTGKINGAVVVAPPPGSDIYIKASRYSWTPVLRLKKGERYKLHTYSVDYLHGFKIHELKTRFEATPNYETTFDFSPDKAGEFEIICDEFCGEGHHQMKGLIIVDP